jgi:hypothetical protein
MKATELRIGNWVKWNYEESRGNYEESSDGNAYPVEFGYELDDIKNNPNIVKPIPLTEEWFVKLGYAVRKSLGFEAYEINDIYTVYYNTAATPNGFEMCFGENGYISSRTSTSI